MGNVRKSSIILYSDIVEKNYSKIMMKTMKKADHGIFT